MKSAAELFTQAFDDELAQYSPDASWNISGRPTKANPHGEDEGWWRTEGPAMVQRWMDWRAQSTWDIWITPDGQPAIELEIVVPLAGIPIKMYVDRVFATAPDNGRPLPVDLKSGARAPVGHLQLGLYKVGIELQYPEVRVFGGAYWSARAGQMEGVASLAWATPAYYGALFQRAKEGRDIGAFLPNVGPLCKSCKVGKYCAINNGEFAHLDPDYELMGA